MKATLFTLGFAATASANIIFNHVPLKCNITSTQMYHGCLRGQDCTAQGDCVALENINYPKSFGAVPNLQLRADVFSTDGTCGPKNGNTVCDPNSKAYTGGCCSQYGYCGNTADHCGTGCTSGCQSQPPNAPTNPTTPANPALPIAARQDGRCGKEFGNSACDANGPFGGCCSEYGYCGSTEGHCKASNGCQNGCDGSNPPTTPAQPNTTNTAATPDSPARDDGRCGKEFGGASCDPLGEFGGCCSEYGFCGKTEGHCLKANGCQNGCTDGGNTGIKGGDGPAAPAPTASPATTGEPVIAPATSTAPPHVVATAAATTDGSCGSTNGGTVCGNWANGNCCSMYGFCGATSAHCGAGCQSGNCLNAPAVAAPGPSPAPAAPNKGSFKVVGDSGVPAMHAALMPNGKVMFLDKLENYTQLKNPNGAYAMSSEYDPATNKVVPLAYDTNAFCSGGVFLADGRVISVGGNGPLDWLDPNIKDGFDAIRYLGRSSSDAGLDGQSWSEPGNKLASKRWYASAQTMPDGTIFVASGSLNGLDPTVLANNNPTWELLDRNAVSNGQNIEMEILKKNQPYYMYPFVHLLNDGNLFVFTSKSSQIFNVGGNTIVKELPDLPGDYRTYPNTGGSVMMALTSKNNWAPDVIICGGGAYQDINSPTDASCGRIQPLAADATWEMDSMPQGRGMVEGTLLADGSIVWLNGGNRGAQGFGIMKDPTLDALLYEPNKPKGQRFSTLATSEIPRLYHSVALLLLDGTLMVTGSNPVEMPMLQADANNPYVTDFRVEIYTPPYLQGDNANRRPTNIAISSLAIKADGSNFQIQFTAPANAKEVKVSLYHGGFVTHSVHMGHRMLDLDVSGFTAGGTQQSITVAGPPNLNVAPPGPYVVYVLVDGVPGIGQFVSVS